MAFNKSSKAYALALAAAFSLCGCSSLERKVQASRVQPVQQRVLAQKPADPEYSKLIKEYAWGASESKAEERTTYKEYTKEEIKELRESDPEVYSALMELPKIMIRYYDRFLGNKTDLEGKDYFQLVELDNQREKEYNALMDDLEKLTEDVSGGLGGTNRYPLGLFSGEEDE